MIDAPGLRPTPERARETLFNWLGGAARGARCLDLYAGSGALGLEALSRGARHALFVESNAQALGALARALAQLDADADATLRQGDAARWLHAGRDREETFGLVFMDPPFGKPPLASCCVQLEASGRLASDAWVYTEGEALATETPVNWRLHRHGRVGMVHYALYQRLAPPDDLRAPKPAAKLSP